MALLLKNNLLFLHIPKTGGSWVQKLLEDHDCVRKEIEHKHATYDLLVPSLRKGKHLTCIAVVRHPISWYESFWKYRMVRGFPNRGIHANPKHWRVTAPLNGICSSDISAFVNQIHARSPGFVSQMYAAYTDRSGAIVLKQESLRDDFAQVNKRFKLGIPEEAIYKSQPQNVSPPIPAHWTKDTLKRTLELEAAAFAAYGYPACKP